MIRPAESIVGRLTVAAPSGYEYVIKPLSPFQLMAAFGGLTDLAPLLEDMAAGDIEPSRTQIARIEGRVDRVVRAGLLEPQLPEGADVWALGFQDVMFLFARIQELSGFTREQAESVGPLSGAGTPSSVSTSSPGDTVAGPRSLQEAN